MNRLNIASVGDALVNRLNSVIAATIVDFQVVSPTMARVVATFNSVDAAPEVLSAAVGKALENNATPVEASWRRVSSYGNPAMVGFVTLNRETRPYSEAAAKRMTALSSNMLMDAQDDSLWEVRNDGAGGKLLCRQNDNGLRALIETARVRQARAPRLDSIMSAADSGDFVAFVDPASEVVRYGYVLATDLEIAPLPTGGVDLDPEDRLDAVEVLPLDFDTALPPDNTSDESTGDGNRIAERLVEDQAPVTVPCSLIVESANMNGSDKVAEVAAPTNAMNKQALLDYYKRLYVHRPDYYGELKNIIENHAGF